LASMVERLATGFDRGERMRLAACYGTIALIHVVGWGALLTYGVGHPAFIGLGGLAYTFGLRHAFDADHISAIDNTTRKLLQQKQKPVSVGFWFSLGHCTVVLLIALALGFAAHAFVNSVITDGGQLKNVGGLVGTSVSGFFLVMIGIVNLLVLLDIVRVYRKMRLGEYDRTSLHEELITGGFMTRVFGRLFRVVTKSWHMYPIGFLFGLGFDTTSEIAFLAIAAGTASQGIPFVAVVSLPLIFAAGMTLMDTTDGAFMAKAYTWAFSNPIRKVFYNLTITGLSVFVALFVGGVELLQILAQVANLNGGFWSLVTGLNFANMGFFIVAAFVGTWVAAFTIFKVRKVDERWSALMQDEEKGAA
jgi:high-affinity nickel-transport protein